MDQYRNDASGYRVLAGGIDGEHVLSLEPGPTLTWALVVRRVAQAAAQGVVENDLGGGANRRLLLTVTTGDTAKDPAFEQELRALYWRLLSRRPDDAEIAGLSALWVDIAERSGGKAGWVGVVSALFQDPDFVSE